MIDDERVMSRFCSYLGEERTICIGHFIVAKTNDADGGRLYLKLMVNSLVHRPVLPLPRHCFNVVTIPQVAAGYTESCGLFGEFLSLLSCLIFFLDLFMHVCVFLQGIGSFAILFPFCGFLVRCVWVFR